ncbi:glutamate--tRNA ligase [Tumebacillus permanentifrigoris]|uniref:Glutamate--tRNA ligase n=1 Tax=Tumebacillus permanentifrigoris TaxID=378543 RepID=A0A316D370_9BACL|nr:glutamate--tRNA ligase [Tumebacillus permanentifrigoris]PWK05652.1 glutamyl-tRNA synthetase /glutamate--tRNA(Gln) ligase [Tumebacillus permanentifrigoris]
MTVRLRYAPSPTGHLHIGGARTALFNYLYAKKLGGEYILRIEDTDQARNKENAEVGFMNGFEWLGLNWDEGPRVGGEYGPYSCMERLDIYQTYTDQLLAEGKAFHCYCSAEELEAEREALSAKGETPRYMGKCRNLTAEERSAHEAAGRKASIRFRVPDDQVLKFHDMIRGDIEFESNGIGDYVIVKSDGIPTYNFAVTIDDALMKITHVVRGEEHLSNTPRQLLIYEALGWALPEFAHLPLILNETGKKLSKRDESIVQFIEQYAELGYLPEAINNFLALLGWSPGGEQEIFSMDELIAQFSFERVQKSGAIFDSGKLAWMNGQYIKAAELDRIVDLAIPFLQKAGFIGADYDRAWVSQLVELYKDGMNAVSEIAELSQMFFATDVAYDEAAQAVLSEESAPTVLAAFRDQVQELPDFNADTIKAALKDVQKATGFKGKQLFMPVRVAVTGQEHGRDLNITLSLLGREKVVNRLTQLVQ